MFHFIDKYLKSKNGILLILVCHALAVKSVFSSHLIATYAYDHDPEPSTVVQFLNHCNTMVFISNQQTVTEEISGLLRDKTQVSFAKWNDTMSFDYWLNYSDEQKWYTDTTAVFIFLSTVTDLESFAIKITDHEQSFGIKKVKYYLMWPEKKADKLNRRLLTRIAKKFKIYTNTFVATWMIRSGSLVLKYLELYSINGEAIIQDTLLETSSNYDRQFRSIWSRRTDFNEKEIIVANQGYVKMESAIVDSNGTLVLTAGTHTDFLNYLKESYNFRIILKSGSGWISLHENGTLGGMGGEVDSGEVDISISSSELLENRVGRLSFLHPTFVSKFWGIFVQPPAYSFRNMFLQSMSGKSWLMFIFVWLAILIGIKSISNISSRTSALQHQKCQKLDLNPLWVFAIISQQSWYTTPTSFPLRCAYITGLLSGVIMFTGYCSSLVSNLSVPFQPIHSLDDLITNNFEVYRSAWTVRTASIIADLESKGKIPSKPPETIAIQPKYTLSKIMSGKSVMIGNDDDLFFVYGQDDKDEQLLHFICGKISKVLLKNAPIFSGMFVKKGSYLKKPFNIKLTKLRETGIQFMRLKFYLQRVTMICEPQKGIVGEPLGINYLTSAFLLLLISFIISGLILVLEIK